MALKICSLRPLHRVFFARVWGLLVTVSAVAVFLYQTSFNIEMFLDKPTLFMVTMEQNPDFRLPPITICPQLVFEPTRVKELGLDISGNHLQIEENLFTLKGIPENLSVTQLWMETSWYIGQFIRYVSFDSNLTIYSDYDKKSSLWRYSLSPLGRCLTLFPSRGTVEVSVVANVMPYISPCQWVDENGDRRKYLPYRTTCILVAEKCNSSCGLEDYIYYSATQDYIYVYFHGTPVTPIEEDADEKEVIHFSSLLFDGHYVLKKFFRTPSITSKTVLVDSSLAKGPCISDDMYDYGECHRKLLTEIALEKYSCRPVTFPPKSEFVEDFCYSPELITNVYTVDSETQRSCRRKCKQTKWLHTFSESYDGDYVLNLFAASTDIRKEVEIEAYPMSQLASDAGGSLGLFLGVSILSFWKALIQLLQAGNARYCVVSKPNEELTCNLLHYSGITMLSMATAVHCLVSLNTYISQDFFTSVNLSPDYNNNENINIHIMRRLSSRAFDCRPYELDIEQCKVNCILEDAVSGLSQFAPFVNVDDLPPCENKTFTLLSYEYVVPPAMVTVATEANREAKCRKQCLNYHEPQNATTSYSMQMKVNSEYYLFDTLRLLCTIGGTVGLYLGYSIVDAVDAYRKGLSKRIVRALKACVFMFGLVIGLWQGHSFVVHHQMTSSSTIPSWTDRDMLVMTVCRWPPYDYTRITKLLGLDITETKILRLATEDRIRTVMEILDLSVGNLSVPIDELWEKSAWSIEEVISGFLNKYENETQHGHFCEWSSGCEEVWEPVVTQMNRCYSMNISDEDSSLKQVVILFPRALENTRIFGLKPQFYFSVHSHGEYPMISEMIYRLPSQKAVADLHTVRLRRLEMTSENTGTSYGNCVHECFGQSTVDAFGCRLPYVTMREDVQYCNQSQYGEIPAYFRGLEGIGNKLSALRSLENGSDTVVSITESCYLKCRQHRNMFTSFKLDRESDYYPTITMRIREENRAIVAEEDRHTMAQLLSDLGGVASSTVGFSLLYLLKDLLINTFAAQ